MKFKLFGRLFKPKAKGGSPALKSPGDRKDPHIIINELIAKGLPEAEIIRSLKDSGYTFKEIDDALNESVRSEVAGPDQGYAQECSGQYSPYDTDLQSQAPPQGSYGDQYLNDDLNNMDQADFQVDRKPNVFTDSTNRAPLGMEPIQGLSMPEEEGKQSQQSFADMDRESVYEIVESVVSERMNSLKSEMKEINDQLKSIQQIISEFKANVQEQDDARRKELGSAHEKIKDASVHVVELEPRVSGLEKAFKDIVPNLVDSVREVKELVQSNAGDLSFEHERGGIKNKPHDGDKDIFDDPAGMFGEHKSDNPGNMGSETASGQNDDNSAHEHASHQSKQGRKSIFD